MPDCLGVCFLVAAALLPAGEARALWDDRLELSAAQSAYHDDNVLRQPAGESADTYRVTTLGLRLDAPAGRQRLRGDLAVNSVRYRRFGEFDLDGHDGQAAWLWRPGEETNARLGFAHRRTLASLANLQAGVQSRTPNALTTRRAFAAGEAMLAPRWQLALEGSRLEQSNAAAERQPNDLALDGGEARISYLSRAGNRLGLRARLARGDLPNAQPIGAAAVDNSYRQRELGAHLDWRPGAFTRLRAQLGRVQRDYRQFPARDFEATAGELLLDWTTGGRLELAALAQRGISETEEIHVSFVFAERLALQAKYRLGASTELAALLESSERRYLGDAAVLLGAAPARSERLQAAGLQAGYRAAHGVTLSLSWRRETRSASDPASDYAVNVYSLGARLAL
jgi:hypothetical protein